MFFKKRMRGSTRGVASADRLTDLRINKHVPSPPEIPSQERFLLVVSVPRARLLPIHRGLASDGRRADGVSLRGLDRLADAIATIPSVTSSVSRSVARSVSSSVALWLSTGER
jgi:hypothetical protein